MSEMTERERAIANKNGWAGIFVGLVFGGLLMFAGLTHTKAFGMGRELHEYRVEELKQAIETREALIATEIAELEASK